MSEPQTSLDDVQLLSLVDRTLAAAVRLWAQRPAPMQRPERIAFGDSIWELKEKMGEESWKLLLPETAKVTYSIMRNFFGTKGERPSLFT